VWVRFPQLEYVLFETLTARAQLDHRHNTRCFCFSFPQRVGSKSQRYNSNYSGALSVFFPPPPTSKTRSGAILPKQ